MTKSPRLSFTGYSVGTALYRNKDNIKAIVALLGTYMTYVTSSGGFDWKAFLIAFGLAGSALAVKLIADAVDFYFAEIQK
jgi:hypothetical protein